MRKFWGILIILLALLAAGCRKEEPIGVGTEKTANESLVESEETNETKLAYFQIEESYDVLMSENCSQWHIFEDKVYSLEFEMTDDGSAYYLKSCDKNGETKEYRSDAYADLSWKQWCLSKENGKEILSILSRDDDSHYFILRVDLESLETKIIYAEDDMFRKKTIQNIVVTPDSKYLLDSYEYMYFLTADGKMEQCTYKVDGYSVFASDKNPRLQKGQMLYSYNMETWEPEPHCSLSDSRIRKEDVRDISFWKDKYYVLIEEEEGFTIDILSENKDVVKEEKIQLVLFQPFIKVITQEDIDEFNFENDKYEVVLESVSTDMQFRFIQEELPDIVCLIGFEALAMPDYVRAGYFRDLYPFIDKSDKIKRDDLLESMVEGLEINGKLYGLSEKVTFQTPFIYDDVDTSDYNARTAIDMYVKTAKEHDFAGLWSVESLQELVFTGLMNDIFTDESGKRRLNSKIVKEMLERMKNSGAAIERDDLGKMNVSQRDFYFGSRNRIENIMGISEITDGYKLKILGYPSLSGEPVFLQGFSNIMAISKSCKDPEGAFEFIEFMMTRANLYGNQEGSFFCLKSLNKKERYPGTLRHYTELMPLNVVIDGEAHEIENPDEKYDFLQYMSEHVVFETEEYWNASDIIFAEAEPFFRDEKSIDEVMNIIESRINLMLEEEN